MIDRKYAKFVTKQLLGRHLRRFIREKEEYLLLQERLPAFLKVKNAIRTGQKKALYASYGTFDAKAEALYLTALAGAGYHPCVVTLYDPYVAKVYDLFGIGDVTYYERYFRKYPWRKFLPEAKSLLASGEVADLLAVKRNGIRVGEFAASSFMRRTRASGLTLDSPSAKSAMRDALTFSLLSAAAVDDIIDDIRPDIMFIMDRGYSPYGQLFDACLKRGIPVVTRSAAHKSGWEMLKRYDTPDSVQIHPHTLSPESLEYVKTMPWTDERWHQLYEELSGTYMSGDWYSEGGTQFNKKMRSRNELIAQLSLNTDKKTAIIFPHMFWDASFFYGRDLFKDYYDWFANVLRVAAVNRNLNWIVKIHPANVVKAKRDSYLGSHKELLAVHETLGELPAHIRVIPPESDINTFDLFEIMDYCLTVRGTIGIETSAMGINTLTAGTGRYDGIGFTHDFRSADEYLDCLRTLETLPPMTAQTIELARRHAYGIFMLRPIHVDVVDFGYNQDEKASMRFIPVVKSRDEFDGRTFVQHLRKYIASARTDYLNI